MAENRAVVIDNGTGFTKMGYAGNVAPSYTIPSVFADNETASGAGKTGDLKDLDFFIGDEALANYQTYRTQYPIKSGLIENWDHMEKIWQHCIYKYLRCEPQDHYFMLTEPPLNPPENREYTAEIMFETFGVKGLNISVQAVLALFSADQGDSFHPTGTVVDSGDGVTHVIPVAEGYVVSSGIKHIPLAGRTITNFVRDFLLEREGSVIPREDALQVAQRIKEKFGYVCADPAKEFAKFDKDPSKIEKHSETHAKTKREYSLDIGPERFLGPEIFFNPAMFSGDFTTPLSEVVDDSIRASPIDVRRGLYKNIVLSGGSTMFANFEKRLQRDIKKLVTQRMTEAAALRQPGTKAPEPIEVAVKGSDFQQYAVWYGGARLASTEAFYQGCHTKAQYEECGPSICRYNQVFGM